MRKTFLFVLTACTISSAVFADTVTWTGNLSTSWEIPGNWAGNRVPGPSDDVIIPGGTPACNFDTDITVNSIENHGTMGAYGIDDHSIIIETYGFVNYGSFSFYETNVSVGMHFDHFGQPMQFTNYGNIEGGMDQFSYHGFGNLTNEGNINVDNLFLNCTTVNNSSNGTIQGFSIFIGTGEDINNHGIIQGSDGLYSGNNGGSINIESPLGNMFNYGQIIGGLGNGSGKGGTVSINLSDGSLINDGIIQGGFSMGPQYNNGGNIHLWANGFIGGFGSIVAGSPNGSNEISAGEIAFSSMTIVSGTPNPKTFSDPYLDSSSDGTISLIRISADNISILDCNIHSGNAVVITGRTITVSMNSGSFESAGAFDFYTTTSGRVDFSGTHASDIFQAGPGETIGIYSGTIIEPPEGLAEVCGSPYAAHPPVTTLVNGHISIGSTSGMAGFGGSLQVSIQNLSTAVQALTYTISSTKGWVSMSSGSTPPVPSFQSSGFAVDYAIPTGTAAGAKDTVQAVLTITPDFADTVFGTIYCIGEPTSCLIQVVSPNGGETRCSGEEYDITWTSFNTSDSICIQYSADNGETWHTVVADTPDDGVHPWTLPSLQTDSCLVRICDCNDSLCCDESNRVFSVCDRPQVEFAADPETGSGDTCTVQFADLSTGCLTGWVWSFGDGGTSTEQHPTHTFSCNGPQTVSLIVTGPCGSDTVEHTITCTCPASCAITITSPSCSPAGCETLCTDNLYPLAWTVEDYQGNDYHIRYSTDGGGNWADVGTTTNTTYDWTVPDAVWPNDALIEVCCVGSIPPCCDTLAFFIAGQPQAGFTADPEAGSGQTCRVQFTDQSTNCVTSWNWNFGDGGSSTEQNPIHTFDCNGSYLVSLIVTGPCGADTVEHSVSCTCPASCDIIITSPTCSPAGCETLCTGDLYPLAWTVQNCQSGQFTLRYSTNSGDTWTDISTTGNTSFDWSVPDAAWPSASRIEVCCSGEDPPCCDTTAFTILSPPMAVFTVDQQSDTGQTCQVLFTDQSTGSVTAWYWDFGDGGNSTLQHPTHTYTCNGFYTVTLTVSGPCGGDTEIGIETITCTCPDDTLYLPGDVNCDGTITPGDALCAFWRSILGSFQDECDCAESEQAADVNCDGTITPGDALCIFWRSILGDWTEECICEP